MVATRQVLTCRRLRQKKNKKIIIQLICFARFRSLPATRSVLVSFSRLTSARYVLPLGIRLTSDRYVFPLGIRSLRSLTWCPLVRLSSYVCFTRFRSFPATRLASSRSVLVCSLTCLTYARSVLVRSPAWYPLVMFSHLVSPRSFVLTDLFVRFRFVCPHKFVSLDSGYVLLVRHPLVTFSLSSVIDSGFVFCF